MLGAGGGGSSDMHYTTVLYKFCDQVQFTHVQLQNHFGLNFLIRKQTIFMNVTTVGGGGGKQSKKKKGWRSILGNCPLMHQ